MNIAEKFDSLGASSWYEADGLISIRDLEAATGSDFPKDYKYFLEKYKNGVAFDKNIAYIPDVHSPWAAKNTGWQSLDFLYGLNDGRGSVKEAFEKYQDRIPEKYIPIAEAPGGNVIVISCREQSHGKVFFWDHEGETKAKIEDEVASNMYLIKNGFADFVDSLFEKKDVEPDDDGLESIDLRF